jgi:hypothetical protein
VGDDCSLVPRREFMRAEIDRLISAVGFRTWIEPVRSPFHAARRTFVHSVSPFWGRPYDKDGDGPQVEAAYLKTEKTRTQRLGFPLSLAVGLLNYSHC